MTTAKTAATEADQRYFKAPVFAVAPMIDWTARF
jgi:tRNA-dihydrouridine synthase A